VEQVKKPEPVRYKNRSGDGCQLRRIGQIEQVRFKFREEGSMRQKKRSVEEYRCKIELAEGRQVDG
jgi:hypothetical protein